MIPTHLIDDVRSRLDAVEIIGRHVELKKSGSSWLGSCPFHAERTPSFRVYREKKRFHCYGCGADGDVILFLQRFTARDFLAVVRELADEVGVELVEGGRRAPDPARQEREAALAACEAAAAHWADRLWSADGESARAFLATRGVSEETARTFRLGAAAGDWHELHRALERRGLSPADLERAGLVLDKGRGIYDRYRNRLLFPLTRSDSRVNGFIGRALGKDPGAKYLTGPETVIFSKGRCVYGLEQAREAIRATRKAVFVETVFDVLLLHQTGIRNVVGPCGGALSPQHLAALKRCDCRELVLLVGSDGSGEAAPPPVASAIFGGGLTAHVTVIPDASRLGDIARQGGRAAIEALLGGAEPLSEFLIRRATRLHLADEDLSRASFAQRMAVARELAPYVTALPHGVVRSMFEQHVAQRLALDDDAAWRELVTKVPPPAR